MIDTLLLTRLLLRAVIDAAAADVTALFRYYAI